jgi:hypothetical protein
MKNPFSHPSIKWMIFPAIGIGSYLWLLGALFTLVVVAPWTASIEFFNIRLSDILSLMILWAGIAAVSRSRVATLFLTVIAICTIVCQLVVHFRGDFWAAVGANMAGMIFLIGLFMVIAFDVFLNREVTAETLAGACCGYVLIAGIFAAIYSILLQFNPNAISLTMETTIDPKDLVFQSNSYGLLGYYSISTLTTLGYGDIVPNSMASRSAASLEALIGQLYLAVVVARLVGMYISSRSSDKPKYAFAEIE